MSDFNCFKRSLCPTPNFCSSSIIKSPRLANFISFASSACVPIVISTAPSRKASRFFFICDEVTNLESWLTLIFVPRNRSSKDLKCCLANNVVGAIIATCVPAFAAMKAARNATSVLPNPTSPHTNLSIGFPEDISVTTSSIAFIWSSVSTYGKRAQNAFHLSGDTSKISDLRNDLSAAMRSNLFAISRMRSLSFAFLACQALPPNRSNSPVS